MAGRLGQVIYWLGCGVGILFACLGVLLVTHPTALAQSDPATGYAFSVGLFIVAAAAWAVGRGIKYILAGV